MKAFVFTPTNQNIGNFSIQDPEKVPDAFQNFMLSNPPVPIGSYIEASGRKWTVVSQNPLQLLENSSSLPVAIDGKFVCTLCYAAFLLQKAPRRSFLGFPKIHCPACGTETRYPLTTAYRIVYYILIGIAALLLIAGIGIALGAIFWIVALVKDASRRKEISIAWGKHLERQRQTRPPLTKQQ
jgi:hypothetical protein